MARVVMRRAWAAVALLVPLQARAADDEMGRRLQEALRRRGDAVYRCYGATLDRAPRAEGEMLVEVELGEQGRVRRALVLKEQGALPGLGPCLMKTMAGWTLPELGADPGDRVVFPLVFRPDQVPAPGVVIPERQARRPLRRRGEPAGPLVFVDERSHPGAQAALSLWRLAPGSAPGPAPAGGATVLYVLSGAGRLLGPGGLAAALAAGDGVLVPAGASFGLAAAGRQPLTVVRVEATARGGTGASPLIVRGASQGEGLRILGGQGRVKILVDQATAVQAGLAGPLGVSLETLSCEAGAQVPEHRHEESDELLYIVSGRGLMTTGDQRDIPVGPGDVVRVPRGLPHSLVVQERLVAVQSYAPAGPEQRFRRSPTPPARGGDGGAPKGATESGR